MSKSFIILSCILAISQLGNVSHAFYNVPASTRNYELSNSHEEPMVNSDENTSNRNRGEMVFLLLLKNSKENETSLEEKTEEAKDQIHHGQKTKRCMALNLLRKARLISIPKDAQKKLSGLVESSINDSVQNLNDIKPYFRLASRKDTNNILKYLLKSSSSKGGDNDSIVSNSQNQDPIILVSQDLKKSDNQRPKKYVCYCIEDNCTTKKSKQPSRPNAMRTRIGGNILAKNSYSTNEKSQRLSGRIAPEQEDLGAPHNLHCPPGTVLIEESDYPECSGGKHHSRKRRPVKKCSPVIMPCESEAESIRQPTRINIPLAGNRQFNRRIYKVDRTLPFVEKLQSVIKQHYAPGEVPCHEKGSPLNNVLDVPDQYYNNQKNFDSYAQVPMARNLVHPSPYVLYPQHSQYPLYSDSLVSDSQFPSQTVDQPYKGHQEPSYVKTVLGRNFLDTKECIKTFRPSVCTVVKTPISSGNGPKTTRNYEEEHEESTINSQWEKEIHTTTEFPSRKINEWSHIIDAHDNDKIAKTYLQEIEANKADSEDSEKTVSHSGRYSQSRILTKPGEYWTSDTPHQYVSGQPVKLKIHPSYNLPRLVNANNKIDSSTTKKPTYFDDHGNFLEPNSLIHHTDPNNIEYLVVTANPGESEIEAYDDITEEAKEDADRAIPSERSVLKFPQLASTSISSPQYLEYMTKPSGKDINPSLSDDTSEVLARYVSTPHSSLSRYGTSEDQYTENIFHQELDRNVDDLTKYYTTRPSESAGIAKQHSIYGSLSYDEKRLESSAKSLNTVFMKMEEPWTNYETTVSMENFKGNRFEDLQKITTVYPVIDDANHTPSPSPKMQNSYNRIDKNAVIPSLNLYYSVQPEQTKTTPPQSPVGMIESTPINNYLKSDFVSRSAFRSDNQDTTFHVAKKNVVHDTTPLLGINKLGQHQFTMTSYPAQNDVEVKTISSWPDEITETNIEDNQGGKLSITHYPARLEIAGIDKYSSSQKSSHLQNIGSDQLRNDERTTEKFYPPFFGANEPTTENVVSVKKHTNYLREPVERPRHQYAPSHIQNLPSENIKSINEHPLDKDLFKKGTNHYGRVPSRNWDYKIQSGKKITSFTDQETSTTDHGAQKQYIGSYRSFADEIITTPRSDELNKRTSHLGTIHLPIVTEALQKSTQQPLKMSSEYNMYSSQVETPLFIMNHRKSTQPENFELGLSTTDNNYSRENMPRTYTSAESILRESTTAGTESHKLGKNLNGTSSNPSNELHQLDTTQSKYGSKEEQGPLETTLSFENNSDMNEEFKGYFASNTFDDIIEEVTGLDPYYEETDSKNYNNFNSTSSGDWTVTDNNEIKDINSSTVIDEDVGVANRPKPTFASSINNSKHYMRYHNGVVDESFQKESTLNDEVIIETPSYKEDDDVSLMIQTINGKVPHSYPRKNYEEKHLSTNYYETVTPKSKDDMTRIFKDKVENPLDLSYSSTPMSVTHSIRNPLTFSDILKSENVVHDTSRTEGRSNDYSTNPHSQNTPETRIQNPVKDNDKLNAVSEQNELTSQRHIVSGTLPTLSSVKNHLLAVSNKKEKLITINNKLFGETNEKQRMIPYDKVGDVPSKANFYTRIENDVSPTQPKYCSESLAKAKSTFDTDNEKNTLRDVNRLNNHKIAHSSYSVTEFPTFEEFTRSSDLITDALMSMVARDDKAEATISTTETINEQYDVSKNNSSLKTFTASYDRIGNLEKGIIKLSAIPIATTPDINAENAIKPISTLNELLAEEYMYTNDPSSLEYSPATEYSTGPCEATSSSPRVENTPNSRSVAVSDFTVSTLKKVLSSTVNNKESVEKPLGLDSTAPINRTNVLRLFSTGKSADNSYEKYSALKSMDQITLQRHNDEHQTTPANECTENSLNEDEASDEDRSYLTSVVQKVVQNLTSPESNNAYKNAPNTPDTVVTLNQESSSALPLLKNLFLLPEVKDMVINTVKGLISEASGEPENNLFGRLKNQEIESVLNRAVNNVLLGKSTTLSPSIIVEKQQYINGDWMVVPAPLASIKDDVTQNPADEIFNTIQHIIERAEIGLQGARLPVVQNIIVHAVENVLTKAKKVVDHSLIWETLNNIIARAENAGNSTLQPLPTLGPLPKISDKKTPNGSIKNMPIIPVIERVFKNGQWSEKQTVLGIRKKPLDSKLLPSTTATANDDSELITSLSNHKTSMINANNLRGTTNAVDYALLGESEENEDKSTTQDVVEVNGNGSIEKVIENVDVTTSKQNNEHKGDPENAPIKYYSPNDRILTYIKNHQTLDGKTDTTFHFSDTVKGTEYYCPSPDKQTNAFSTIERLVESPHATAPDSDEVPVVEVETVESPHATVPDSDEVPVVEVETVESPHATAPDSDEVSVAEVETAQSGESGERIASGDQSTTESLCHKFTKIPTNYDSSQDTRTLTHGLFSAAKSRNKSQYVQDDIKNSQNFVTPKSDPTYFGKLSLNVANPSEDRISDLTNTDLFYIGDGVKIPLVIRRMPDGSYTLSISEKICEKFVNRKCPCCVPNEGNIVEERQGDVADGVEFKMTSKNNSYDLASFDPTENSKYESESKRRYVRSTAGRDIIKTKISPVKSFVKKYNMTVNLVKDRIPQQSLTINENESQDIRNTRRNKRLGSLRDTKIMNLFDNNQIQRDDSEERMQITDDNSEVISKESNFIRRSEFSYDKDINSFIHNLLNIRDVPEHKRTEIVINALDGLINSASAKNLIPIRHQSVTKFIDENSTEDQSQWEDTSVYDLQDVKNKIAGYGYQKDNPILERITFIKENQHGHGQYKYQQNIDHHAKGKMNILKTLLHWLREVFLEAKGNDKT